MYCTSKKEEKHILVNFVVHAHCGLQRVLNYCTYRPGFLAVVCFGSTEGSSDIDIFLEIQYASCVIGLALKS